MRPEFVKEVVERITNINDISNKTRKIEYIKARAIFYNIVKENTHLDLKKIGSYMGVDHATVINGLKQFDSYYHYPDFEDQYNKVRDICEYSGFEIDDIDKIVNIKREIINLRNENEKLLQSVSNFNNVNDDAKYIIDVMQGLTPKQIEQAKEKLYLFASMCKDQNKRNKLFVTKQENLN